jgi:hypothetical protein
LRRRNIERRNFEPDSFSAKNPMQMLDGHILTFFN